MGYYEDCCRRKRWSGLEPHSFSCSLRRLSVSYEAAAEVQDKSKTTNSDMSLSQYALFLLLYQSVILTCQCLALVNKRNKTKP